MQESKVIISAFADEDHRLRILVESLSPDQQTRTCDDGMCIRALLCHIAVWDKAVVDFFTRKISGESSEQCIHSFVELEKQNKERESDLLLMCFSDIYNEYIETTIKLQNFILRNWLDMSDDEQGYFTIPLQHRRHHRHKFEKALDLPDSQNRERAITA
jgi:hypothetical protein